MRNHLIVSGLIINLIILASFYLEAELWKTGPQMADVIRAPLKAPTKHLSQFLGESQSWDENFLQNFGKCFTNSAPRPQETPSFLIFWHCQRKSICWRRIVIIHVAEHQSSLDPEAQLHYIIRRRWIGMNWQSNRPWLSFLVRALACRKSSKLDVWSC